MAKGIGQTGGKGRFVAQKGEPSSSNQQEQQDRDSDSKGRRPYHGGRGRGRGKETTFCCYKCNKLGHRSFEFPKRDNIGQGGAYIAQNERQ